MQLMLGCKFIKVLYYTLDKINDYTDGLDSPWCA